MTSTQADPTVAGVEAADVRKAAAGDAQAFERLYRLHVGRIHGLARRMAGDGDAQELTQEIFVKAWAKLKTFRGESAFGTWLYRLGINTLLTHRQSMARQRARFGPGDLIESVPARPAPGDHHMDFDVALRKLPRGARQILLLHDVEGFKHEEIATMLSISSGTSKAQLHRARLLMRSTLEAWGTSS